MKKLNYGYAVVSFSPDLTNAASEALPLAALLVGELNDEPVAAIAWLNVPKRVFSEDPFAAAVLNDLPKLLKDHVDQAWSELCEQPHAYSQLLRKLQDALRNTLHVSEISQPIEREIADIDDGTTAANLLVSELTGRFNEALHRVAPPRPRAVFNGPVKQVKTIFSIAPRANEIPELQIWKLRKRQQAEELHA